MITILLDPDFHDRSGFDSGEPSITDYVRKHARQWSDKGLAACYVYSDESGAIIGYYTISASSINPSELSALQQKTLPRSISIPAILLGRLGVDVRYQQQGIGSMLVTDALKRALSSEIAWNVFVVDALNDRARRWYESMGFVVIIERPVRLAMPRQTVAELFGH